MSQEKVAQIALSLIPGIGNVMTKLLVSYCGSASMVLNEKKAKLLKIPGIGEVITQNISNHKSNAIAVAEKQYARLINMRINPLFYTDKDYPHRLKTLHDAPTLFYFKGNISLNHQIHVGIVGTRKPSAYGIEMTEKITIALEKYNPTIISGLAYGVDVAAHRACISNRINTIGVLGSGIDIVYPGAHIKVADKICEQGGIISEYPLGTKPQMNHFPERNRIVAGLCDVIIVVEASLKGGALITAELANQYHREVFALPGNINNENAMGCNRLIANHKAHIFTDISDLEYLMDWKHQLISEKNDLNSTALNNLANLSNEEQVLAKALIANDLLHIDEICWSTGFSMNKVSALLLQLEFQSLVKSLPGKKFKWKK